MHFGLYLVKNSVIDSDLFVVALEQQLASRPLLGSLAIETHKLSVKQVFEVLRTQFDTPGELFGQIAIKLGFLTDEELSSLIYLQSTRQKPIADILVDENLAPESDVLNYLAQYHNGKQQVEQETAAIAC